MKRIILLLWLLAMAGMVPLSAQINAFNGFCTNGGKSAVVQGLSSSNKLDQLIPSCTVTVYLTGTTTLATIYRDSLSTPLSNPFTADSLSAVAPGKWLFYALDGQGYDVTMSGGIPPLTFSAPVTFTDLIHGGSGGGSGVTSVSCDPAMGNLLGCNVTNPGTTPGFHWTLNNQNAQTIYGNFTGSSRGPFFAVYSCTGLLTCTFDTPSNTLTLNVPIASALSVTATSPILVNGGTGPVSSGTANISCPTCGTPNTTTYVTVPAGNYVVIYPHRFTVTRHDSHTITGDANGQNGSGYISMGNTCSLSYTNIGTWDQYNLADVGLTAGQVLDVAAFAVASISSTDANTFCYPTLADPNWASSAITSGAATLSLPASQPSAMQQTGPTATGFTGSQVATATTVASMTVTGATRIFTNYSIASVGLIIHYSGTATPLPGRLYVRPPLGYDLTTNSIFLDPNFPQYLNGWPVGHAPDPTLAYAQGVIITGTTDCVTPSGNPNDSAWCHPVNTGGFTFAWAPFTTGGTATTYFTETLTCTSTCTLAHSPAVFDNLSVNGLVMINGTDFTQSGTTVTLTTPAVGGDVYYAQYHY